MRRRKRYNPGEMPVLGGAVEDWSHTLKKAAAVALAAVVLLGTAGGRPALARDTPPPSAAAIARAPLLTMEGMISAGQLPYDEALMVDRGDTSLVKNLLDSILSGGLLPAITFDDAEAAGTKGDELAVAYGREAALEDSGDEDMVEGGPGVDLAQAPDAAQDDAPKDEDLAAPSPGGGGVTEETPSDPPSPDLDPPDAPDTSSEELAGMGIPGESPPVERPADDPTLAAAPPEPVEQPESPSEPPTRH
ncbi:MAG: hypothetical protein M3P49_00845, partial [Actinomycetota bacterium]|nr:hypothetical protein [Actinomycetota bacterium]